MVNELLTITPRAQRYAVRNPDSIYVAIERADGRDTSRLIVEPMDLSDGGVKLRVSEPFGFEEAITMVLGCVEGPLRLKLTCRVAWQREEWEDCWQMGCQFVPTLPSEAMEELFASGAIERRQFPRQPIAGSATAQWELESDALIVEPVDLSPAGFCIRSPQPAQIGLRMRLNIGTGPTCVTLSAKTQWCLQFGGKFVIGCAFLNRDSFSKFKTALGE